MSGKRRREFTPFPWHILVIKMAEDNITLGIVG